MGKTSIEWCDFSINPIRARDRLTNAIGHYCEKISHGCTNCYSSNLQKRFKMPAFPGGGASDRLTLPMASDERCVPVGDDLEVFLDRSKLVEVRRRRQPTRFFWCDMTDLFGNWVKAEWIDECFATMALSPQHTHLVLTKRPERMLQWFNAKTPDEKFPDFEPLDRHSRVQQHVDFAIMGGEGATTPCSWPLENVWLGVSTEDQQQADARIPKLLKTPAAIRFISAEPLLEPVILHKYFAKCECGSPGHDFTSCPNYGGVAKTDERTGCKQLRPLLRWVIAGGESGTSARPCDVSWIRSLVKQCQAAGVAAFVKQLGKWISGPHDFDGWQGSIDRWLLRGADGSTGIYRRPVLRSDYAPEYFDERPQNAVAWGLADAKGGRMSEWPADLRVREFPTVEAR